jgi:hypothetical protein
MTPEPIRNVEIPRVGRDVNFQRGATGDAYEAAGESYQSVTALRVTLIGLLLMAVLGVTLMMVAGYSRAGWAGAVVSVAVVGMVLTIVCRAE